jgi:hypothetical protein
MFEYKSCCIRLIFTYTMYLLTTLGTTGYNEWELSEIEGITQNVGKVAHWLLVLDETLDEEEKTRYKRSASILKNLDEPSREMTPDELFIKRVLDLWERMREPYLMKLASFHKDCSDCVKNAKDRAELNALQIVREQQRKEELLSKKTELRKQIETLNQELERL